MTFEDLVTAALIGTSRGAPTFVHDDPAVASALSKVDAGDVDDQLLSAAAVLSAYEICGARANRPTPDAREPAPDDRWPSCSRRASNLLAAMLDSPETPTNQRLLSEWLHAAAKAKRRVPHSLLPALLDHGVTHRAARESITAVIDRRGMWLMAMNERLRYAADEHQDATLIWSTGDREQRMSALRRLRATDPAGARTLLNTTWKQDGADERASFVETMSEGLSIDDEPLLEAALDDRSKQVRAAAARLLYRLKESALVRRMVARVDPLLVLPPATATRSTTPPPAPKIEVSLPADRFDPAWARDGVVEKPEARVGQRQWWLGQMLAAVPPSYWSTKWQRSPAECVQAAAGDFGELLCDAWATAAERYAETEWISALFNASLHGRRGGPRFELIDHLPIDRQRAALVDVLSLPDVDPRAMATLLEAAPLDLDDETARMAMRYVEKLITKSGATYNYHAAVLLPLLGLRVPPRLRETFASSCVGPAWDANRKPLDHFLQTLQSRGDIAREFAS